MQDADAMLVFSRCNYRGGIALRLSCIFCSFPCFSGPCSAISRAYFALLVAFLVFFGVGARWARAVDVSEAEIQNKRCLDCHGQSHIATLSPQERREMIAPGVGPAPATEAPTRPELYLEPGKPGAAGGGLAASVHAKAACVSCHANAKTLPHAEVLGPATCTGGGCHAAAESSYIQGIHAEARAKGNMLAPTCVTCHGGHDVLPPSDPKARTFPLNVIKVCGDCHEKQRTKTAAGLSNFQQVQSYLESVHGRAVLGGLAVAATCADCHGSHKILPAANPQSTVNRANVPDTCGHCHVGVMETYAKSIHGEELAKGNPKAPVCTDCHTAHTISRTDLPAFKLAIITECGSCHDKPMRGSGEKKSLYETYRESYHGQATGLGYTVAARCSDCHGAHDIQRINAPNSRLNAQNRIETCRQKGCHPGADPKFAEFAPHADFRNGVRYPILHGVYLYFVIMMSASFGFFGLHCLLWLVRSVVERIRHGPHPKASYAKGYAIRRFTKVDRVNHAFVILTFFGLALTGMPLLYSEKAWGRWLADVLGGPETCRIEHRIFAVMLIGNIVVHGVGVVRRFKKMGVKQMLFGPTTMLPRLKDLKDLGGMYAWFLGARHKPKFDRWTYWEKFDYVAEVGGSGIIGLSGLLLWFPVFFSVFVPGWMFNVAMVVHGFEALLAVGFIFTIHFFNAHLRLEKFPVDDVMFTGRMPEEEFKEERAAEYERLAAAGQLEALQGAGAAGVVPAVCGGGRDCGADCRDGVDRADHPGGAEADLRTTTGTRGDKVTKDPGAAEPQPKDERQKTKDERRKVEDGESCQASKRMRDSNTKDIRGSCREIADSRGCGQGIWTWLWMTRNRWPAERAETLPRAPRDRITP